MVIIMAKSRKTKKKVSEPKVEKKAEDKVEDKYCPFCLKTDCNSVLIEIKDREYRCDICDRKYSFMG